MIPTVGRIVHFWHTPEEPRAALITHVAPRRGGVDKDEHDWHVVLRVFAPMGTDEVIADAQFSSVPSVNRWTWPAVVR